MHLDSRPIRCFAHPDVQIFTLPCFKKKHIVAVVEFSKFVELVELSLGVKFGIFAAVR